MCGRALERPRRCVLTFCPVSGDKPPGEDVGGSYRQVMTVLHGKLVALRSATAADVATLATITLQRSLGLRQTPRPFRRQAHCISWCWFDEDSPLGRVRLALVGDVLGAGSVSPVSASGAGIINRGWPIGGCRQAHWR
jgi:hypothetical protein